MMNKMMNKINYGLIGLVFFVNSLAAQDYNILDFGAQPNPNYINTNEINKAIQQCSKEGGGRVIIPRGIFITGTLYLLSNVNLHLEPGAILKGSEDINQYDEMPPGYYYSGKNYMGIFFANDVQNLSISGQGIIDGSGTSFMQENTRFTPSKEERKFTRQKGEEWDSNDLEDGPLKYRPRPGHILTISNSENISIKGVRFIDAPKWTIRVGGCRQVKIAGISIENNLLIPNSDGVHITSSSHVHVTDSSIVAGDDALIVTGFISGRDTYTYGNGSQEAKNIIIDNCIVQSKSAGIRVGYGKKPIENVLFSNIIIYDSNRGIGIFSRDDSSIKDVFFSNIMIETRLHSDGWWGKAEPIHISAIPSSKGGNSGVIENISFHKIEAHSESGILIYSEDQDAIRNIKMTNLKVKIKEAIYTNQYGGNFDLRPAFSIEKGLFEKDIPAFYAKGVKNLSLNDIFLEWDQPTSDFYTHGLEIENFENLILRNFVISSAYEVEDLKDIKISKGKGYQILNDLSFKKNTRIFKQMVVE
jgi:polygalacturonase